MSNILTTSVNGISVNAGVGGSGKVIYSNAINSGTVSNGYNDMLKEQNNKIDLLNTEILMLKRLLISKNFCTQEELDDVMDSIKVEKELVK